MSDENANTEQASAVPAKKAAGPNAVVLIGVLVGSLALGGAAGALVVGPRVAAMRSGGAVAHGGKDAEGHGGKEKDGKGHGKGGHGAEKGSQYRIDNLIVNPAGTQGTRFLMASVAVETPDAETADGLRARDAEVRDVVIATLESRTLEELMAPGARDSLKQRLAQAVLPLTDHAEWVRVYLPQFVVQ